MVFIFPKWRLGNQIFQYFFAKEYAKKGEKIFTTKSQYFQIFDELSVVFIRVPTGNFARYINFWCDQFFRILAKLRVINGIYQKMGEYKDYPGNIEWYDKTSWFLWMFTYIDWFFVYDSTHLQHCIPVLKKNYLLAAQDWLDDIPKDSKKIFVHIRRWDYLEWSVMGKNNLSLPLSFYKDQILYFQERYPKMSFIFLSDDIAWCKVQFAYLSDTFYSENDVGTDFAIMTLCDGAIISASTLSYLGAYYMKPKVEIFAPKYWLGFQDKIWYPEGIDTSKFHYTEI